MTPARALPALRIGQRAATAVVLDGRSEDAEVQRRAEALLVLEECHVVFSREQFGPDSMASLTFEEMTTLLGGIFFVAFNRV